MTNDFPAGFYATIHAIDRFTDATGKLVSLAMLFLVVSISYECFSRYLFDAPTIWVMDTSYIANGSAFMLGCGYALLKGAHVRTDMLWERYSERKKGTIDLIAVVLVLAFPQIAMWLPEALEDKPGLAAPPVPESDASARNTLEGGDMKEPVESDPASPVGEGSADDRRLK